MSTQPSPEDPAPQRRHLLQVFGCLAALLLAIAALAWALASLWNPSTDPNPASSAPGAQTDEAPARSGSRRARRRAASVLREELRRAERELEGMREAARLDVQPDRRAAWRDSIAAQERACEELRARVRAADR